MYPVQDAAQVPTLLAIAEGAIVGQWLKHDGLWWNPVDPRRVERLMRAVAALRDAGARR